MWLGLLLTGLAAVAFSWRLVMVSDLTGQRRSTARREGAKSRTRDALFDKEFGGNHHQFLVLVEDGLSENLEVRDSCEVRLEDTARNAPMPNSDGAPKVLDKPVLSVVVFLRARDDPEVR